MSPRGALAGLAVALAAYGMPEVRAATVTFEPGAFSPNRTRFGSAFGDLPGGIPVLTEDGITMTLERLATGDITDFFLAETGGEFASFFPTTALGLEGMGVRFDFSGLPFDVTLVTLEFQEFGGTKNFAVNDATLFQLASLATLPELVAPGVSAIVADGLITVVGNVNSLRIGGQELAIDNITAVPEPATIVLLGLSAVPLWWRRRARR
ncbi:MAG: PEP-CTERM sorting domain-containing protein [Phycisphaerae bacterium]